MEESYRCYLSACCSEQFCCFPYLTHQNAKNKSTSALIYTHTREPTAPQLVESQEHGATRSKVKARGFRFS